MMLTEASSNFLAAIKKNNAGLRHSDCPVHEKALLLLTEYFSLNISLSEITPARLRDFLGKWFVEKARYSPLHAAEPFPGNSTTASPETRSTDRNQNTHAAESESFPQAGELLDSLMQFFHWVDQGSEGGHQFASQASPVIEQLGHTLPRALEITRVLSRSLRERGGAFGFPEFLTSFEEGGHSEYDIDTPGSVGALEGYFRIHRVEGSSVEAEELISEERVWPIVFPPEVAALLDDQYIINLELVRSAESWQIAGCGFAYPPGTEV
jgi:hypothetical protein